MRDLQRRDLDGVIGDRSERRLAGGRGGRRQVHRIERFHRARHRRINVDDDAVLVALGEDGRDDALAVGVVESVVDDGRGDAESRRIGAVEIDDHRAAVRLQIAGHVDDRGNLAQALQHLGRPGLQRLEILVLERELILGRADGGIDREVLHRLHEQRYARNIRGFLLQPANDLARRRLAIRMGFKVDEEAAGVERDVRAVDPDEGGQAFDVRIGKDHLRQRLLMVGHLVERNRFRRLRHALDDAGVLDGKEALRDRHIEVAGEQERAERYQEHNALMIEHDPQRRGVETGQSLEEPAAACCAAAPMRTQELGAQHRHQGERDNGGNDDGGGERDREFMEQPPDHVAHEQERDQNRDQRHGERDDGEADLRRPLHRRVVRTVALLEKAGDVLDHHDRVVDDEAGRDGQGHQRQIVEAEAGLIHDRQRPDQRQRHRQARDDGRRDVAQEDEYDHHDQADRQRKLEFDVLDGGADGDRAIGQRFDRNRRRQQVAE